jgi:3-oxoacyl-[acyl-carrier protein] reductase
MGENADEVVQTRAIKRLETPEDLVGAWVFLACSDSNFIAGQSLVVDGGSAMN